MTEASVMQGQAERAGTVQPGEEKALEDVISVYKYLVGGVKKMDQILLSGVQYQDKRLQREIKEISFKQKKIHLFGFFFQL